MRLNVSTNAGMLIGRWRNRQTRLTPAMRRAENEVMEYAKERAEFYSSGTSYKIGRDKGYPYAKNRQPDYPMPTLPLYYLNMQSGELRNNWAVNTQNTPQGFTSSLWNKMPYSGFMLGTERMVKRPILSKVGEEVRRMRLNVEHDAYVKVIKG